MLPLEGSFGLNRELVDERGGVGEINYQKKQSHQPISPHRNHEGSNTQQLEWGEILHSP